MKEALKIGIGFMLLLAIGFLALSFQSESNQVLLFFIGTVLFALSFFSYQAHHAYNLFAKERSDKIAKERPCEHCELPILKSDKICPYCKKTQHHNPE